MKYNLYLTGGIIRDEFLGLKSKDYDYSVVIENKDDYENPLEAFNEFENLIKEEGYEVFLSTPSCFTIRARFPKGHLNENLTADFVLARKELGYIKGTRTPKVVLGNLKDDITRRDFTVNALAMDIDGNIIDLYKGQEDLKIGILRTPIDAAVSFKDDPLRILRAMRFAVTKKFMFSDEIIEAISTFPHGGMEVVSVERVRDELHKMFMKDTPRSLQLLSWLEGLNPMLHGSLFDGSLKLEPTLKK